MNRVAIVGAGVSGLAAAWELSRRGVQPVVFEKSRGLSGRAASRSHGAIRYDHGANFFRTSDPEVHALVHHALPTDDLVEIPGSVWTFTHDGVVHPGDPEQNSEPKYSYRGGISSLGKLLAESSGCDVQTSQEISSLQCLAGDWWLTSASGERHGPFDQVLLTAPGPQTSRLLGASSLAEALQNQLISGLAKARYRPQFSFILGFASPFTRLHPFHALVNTDGRHPIAWISFEEDKPGHVPAGQSVVVVQMAPHWSAARLDQPRENLLASVQQELGSLLPGVPRAADWWDSQRWMLAHPEAPADSDVLQGAEEHGLFFAGDALTGRARVPLALKSGLAAARRLVARSSGKRVVTRIC